MYSIFLDIMFLIYSMGGYTSKNNNLEINYNEISKQGGLFRCSTLPLIRE